MKETMNRREFITGAASAVVGMACMWTARRVYGAEDAAKPARVRIGFLSDSHYANVDYAWAGDNRFFFASLAKMRAAVAKFNELKLDMAVEGGDMTDWSRACRITCRSRSEKQNRPFGLPLA